MKITLAAALALLAALPGYPQTSTVPRFRHVFVLVLENQTYDKVIGNTKDMPFLNSLAQQYGLATNYFADAHPSINNYFYLTSGHKGTEGPFLGALADLYPFDVNGPNIASILAAHGMTWKSYAESIPRRGWVGGNRGPYAKRHDPFAYYATVRRSKQQRLNIVPFRQLKDDLENHTLPDYGFIVPNIYHDAHNNPPDAKVQGAAGCGDHAALQYADNWLHENIAPLIASPEFKDSLLVITWDEACDSGKGADSRLAPHDGDDGGGHVATILVSPRIAPGTKSDVLYHHQSTLRTTLEALGIHDFPGLAKTAPDMSGFFMQQTTAAK